MAVIGGGPAGAFAAHFLLQLADRAGLELRLDLFEPRTFRDFGPKGCNMCGGIVSESLLQSLAAEGIRLPVGVVQRRLDSYVLHMDVGSVRIETPLKEKRIAAVHRGSGPLGCEDPVESFDRYLLDMAVASGARVVHERVGAVGREDGRPVVEAKSGRHGPYDFLIAATGVNTPLLKVFETGLPGYRRPRTTAARVCELRLGRWMIERYLGNAMHVFLLNVPGLEFAALIPKGDYATACLLGRDVGKDLMGDFLGSEEVRRVMPPHWDPRGASCGCSPKMATAGALRPYGERVAFVGDCGTTRLYKDGIGAAYRMAKALAGAAVFCGVSERDLRDHYWPACRATMRDNDMGKLVFAVTHQIQRFRFTRRAVWHMTSREQRDKTVPPRMSGVLWDTFTGSATYGSVLARSLSPVFIGRLAWSLGASLAPGTRREKREKPAMINITGFMGKKYRDGEIIFSQGELGASMYVVQEGCVEIIRRDGSAEFCLARLTRGDLFGEGVMFGDGKRPVTARASGDVYVFTLDKAELLRRLHTDSSLAYALLKRMAARIDALEGALVRMATHTWEEAAVPGKETAGPARPDT